jgi:uncharacterized protein YwqG
MNRITLWYARLSRRARISIICMGIAIAVIISALVAYMILVPKKVEVRYGTVVRDPLDGYVWEDHTQTALVNPSEAGNYRVEYIDKYSDEHAQQIEEEKAKKAEEQKELAESTGLEALTTAIPAQQMQDLQTLQQNIDVMGYDIIKGIEMANEISETKSMLVQYRNQVAVVELPPELEALRQQALTLFDMYISACDLYLQAIATGNLSLVDQANALIQEANSIMQGLIPTY